MRGRHYVDIHQKGLRSFAVRRADLVRTERGRLANRYTTVSRHFTFRRASRKAQILNAREGHSS